MIFSNVHSGKKCIWQHCGKTNSLDLDITARQFECQWHGNIRLAQTGGGILPYM